MAFTTAGADGLLDGTTPVTLVSGPVSGENIVKTVTIANTDTASVDVTLRKVSAGGNRTIWAGTLAAGDTLIWDSPVVLDDAASVLEAVMAAPPATEQPSWTSTWGERT